jgi:hypothetical protein
MGMLERVSQPDLKIISGQIFVCVHRFHYPNFIPNHVNIVLRLFDKVALSVIDPRQR